MTDRVKELAAALRCISTAGKGQDCTRCSFWRVEQVPEELRQKLGTAEWRSCDADRIGLAAADELERLARIVQDAEAVLGRRNLLGGSMKVYIAGKITGCENYEARFAEAARFVQGLGHVALNPVVLPAGLSKADYMRICFAMIDSADEVWTLPNAPDSPGATLEIQYCAYTGKPVRTLRTVQEEAEKWLATD